MARTKSHQPDLQRSFTITLFITCCWDVIAIFALTCPGSHLAPCCAAVRLFPHRTQWSCWAFLSPYIPISLHARGGAEEEEERQNGAGHRGGHGCTQSFSCLCSRLSAFSYLVICFVAEIKLGINQRTVRKDGTDSSGGCKVSRLGSSSAFCRGIKVWEYEYNPLLSTGKWLK